MQESWLVAGKTPLTWRHPDAQPLDIARVSTGPRVRPNAAAGAARREHQRVRGVGEGISVIIERA
jgi:hypothetical protein